MVYRVHPPPLTPEEAHPWALNGDVSEPSWTKMRPACFVLVKDFLPLQGNEPSRYSASFQGGRWRVGCRRRDWSWAGRAVMGSHRPRRRRSSCCPSIRTQEGHPVSPVLCCRDIALRELSRSVRRALARRFLSIGVSISWGLLGRQSQEGDVRNTRVPSSSWVKSAILCPRTSSRDGR